MDNLLYLSYGRGPHADEVTYALLSTQHLLGTEQGRYQVNVCTDTPELFEGFPVHLELVDKNTLTDWAGPFNSPFRRKILAVQHFLEKFGGRVIYCDSDTFFLKHPEALFRRVRHGHTLMHIGEYRLDDTCIRELAGFLLRERLRKRARGDWKITPQTTMFNAGVVGIHESDATLLDDVLHLADQIYPTEPITGPLGPRHLLAEQFAFSLCFYQRTKLHQAHDAVCHYWEPTLRAAFRRQLERVLRDSSIPSERQFRELLPLRPTMHVRPFQWGRPTAGQRLLYSLVGMADRAGVKDPLKHVWRRIRKTS